MKVKIVGIFICMLLISAAISVAKTSNENDSITTKNTNKVELDPYTYDEDWWPMFRHDAANSGCSSSIAPDTNELCWQQSTYQATELATPIIVDDMTLSFYRDKIFLAKPADAKSLAKAIHQAIFSKTIVTRSTASIDQMWDQWVHSLESFKESNIPI